MNSVVVESLCEELDKIYGGVDAALQRYGLLNACNTPVQHRFIRLSATKYSALITESQVLPFSYQLTANAMWEITLGCGLGKGNLGSKVSKQCGAKC